MRYKNKDVGELFWQQQLEQLINGSEIRVWQLIFCFLNDCFVAGWKDGQQLIKEVFFWPLFTCQTFFLWWWISENSLKQEGYFCVLRYRRIRELRKKIKGRGQSCKCRIMLYFPTDPFTILETRNQEISDLFVLRECRGSDFEDTKCERVGRVLFELHVICWPTDFETLKSRKFSQVGLTFQNLV